MIKKAGYELLLGRKLKTFFKENFFDKIFDNFFFTIFWLTKMFITKLFLTITFLTTIVWQQFFEENCLHNILRELLWQQLFENFFKENFFWWKSLKSPWSTIPFPALQISREWTFGPQLCDMWTSSDVLCCTASILHLVAIAWDRYRKLVICFSLISLGP